MAAPQSNLRVSLTMDDPIQIDASYSMDEDDRRFIDNEIQACEKHLVDLLLQSRQCSYFTLDPSGADGAGAVLNKGDLFANGPTGTVFVAGAAASTVTGIVLDNRVAPGARFVGLMRGLVPTALSGLSTGSNGFVRKSTAGRCEMVTCLASGDVHLGWATAGYLMFDPGFKLPTIAATPTEIGDAGYTVVEGVDAVIQMGTRTAGRTVTLPASPTTKGYNVAVIDASGQAGTHNITVSGNGNNINGSATDVLSSNYVRQSYLWAGSTYKWIKV